MTDGLQVVVPLNAIGSATGRINFLVNSSVIVAPLTAVLFDHLPDTKLSPARVQ